MEKCIECGKEFSDNELFDGLCSSCLRKLQAVGTTQTCLECHKQFAPEDLNDGLCIKCIKELQKVKPQPEHICKECGKKLVGDEIGEEICTSCQKKEEKAIKETPEEKPTDVTPAASKKSKITHKNTDKEEKTIIILKQKNNGFGIASFIFGLISIFIFSPIFVPLAWLLGVIGLIKKQIVWSILGIVFAIIGFITSPILMGILSNILVLGGLATLGAHLQSEAEQDSTIQYKKERSAIVRSDTQAKKREASIQKREEKTKQNESGLVDFTLGSSFSSSEKKPNSSFTRKQNERKSLPTSDIQLRKYDATDLVGAPATMVEFGGYKTPTCRLALSNDGKALYLKKINSTCKKLTNSKGAKIVCNSDITVCKTDDELKEFVMANTNNHTQLQPNSNTGSHDDLKQLFTNWNKAINNKDTSLLEYLYAGELKYYGKKLSRSKAINDKQRALTRYPEFSQKIEAVKYEKIMKNLYRISFNKYTKMKHSSKEKKYPSYLYTKKINGEWRIVEEGDKITDRIL